MALNALVNSFCHNQKVCGTERANRRPHLSSRLKWQLAVADPRGWRDAFSLLGICKYSRPTDFFIAYSER